jgi:hypothetical protein
MIYKRYLLTSKEQSEKKANLFLLENGKADFVWLDKFEITQGEYNDKGVEIVAPTFTKSYSLDVMWHDLDASPFGWDSYEIIPDNPKHVIF